ncbi:hypothetical protein N7520_000066 [Penicillium odoratum]|uniref:uncharacterized protein n=1 Tax=Penicillium odoratum TaxID=1167516 RepID=UPI002549700B|nr:uncharacterized protein N7520_000066 [Penicillium odoratum]KAJ5776820.1 hypothetical protein N7520_000066 [Penicillium odoratum]
MTASLIQAGASARLEGLNGLAGEDVQRAKSRLEQALHEMTEEQFNWAMLLSMSRKRNFWALLGLKILFWNSGTNTTAGGYPLWLKGLYWYSISKPNDLATTVSVLGILDTLFICFTSELFYGPAWAISVHNV